MDQDFERQAIKDLKKMARFYVMHGDKLKAYELLELAIQIERRISSYDDPTIIYRFSEEAKIAS